MKKDSYLGKILFCMGIFLPTMTPGRELAFTARPLRERLLHHSRRPEEGGKWSFFFIFIFGRGGIWGAGSQE